MVARTFQMLSALISAGVFAQPHPQMPVRIIVPDGATGDTDLVACIISPRPVESRGQHFIVESRPGVGSRIGTKAMPCVPANGYTFKIKSIKGNGFSADPEFGPLLAVRPFGLF